MVSMEKIKEIFNFKFDSLIRVFVYNYKTGEIRDATEDCIYEKYEDYLVIDEDVLDLLINGFIVDIDFSTIAMVQIPSFMKFYGITRTSKVYANTPLWTTFWKILWFRAEEPKKHIFNYIEEPIYIGYEFSPRIGSTVRHYVKRYPIIQKEEPKDEELPPEGHCIFCGTKLPEEPNYYEWGLGDDDEPTVPVFICPKCGEKNYGFRIGELVRDIYGR